MKKIILEIIETDFGSSTSAEAFVRNGRVVRVRDTSSGDTNYVWDGWGESLPSLVGKTIPQVREWASHFFDDCDYAPRQPHVKVIEPHPKNSMTF